MKEMKTRGAANGSMISGFPRTMPDSARRAWTVHRPSSCMVDQPPAAHEERLLKKISAGTKTNRKEKMLSQLHTSATISHLLIYVTRQINGSQGPHPSVLALQHCRCGDYTQISGSFTKLVVMEASQAFRDVYTLPFGKNYVCFFQSVCVCLCDKLMERSR